ncbi:type I-E CRISPR-associated protein Cas6/Cse3/CasE [Streptomyces sp. NPDC058049]|uniref:type I-E CRISPR-associated protein Cas6/Cse3/CasE n=1 Tax=Streptomyces sp. NPDC058049 TaxID=3346314 RepID=UPI0036E8A075
MTTTTLTRIHLNLASPRVRRDLVDATSLHRTVMLFAPDDLGPHPRHQAGLLFRLEPTHSGTTPPLLLIQTRHLPDLTRLPATYGTTQTRSLAPTLNGLTPGRQIHYRITANPTAHHRLHDDDGRPLPGTYRKRTALTGDQAIAWWHRRATEAGLTLHTLHTTPQPAARTHPNPPATPTPAGRTPRARHVLTRFDGIATITNPDQLRDALLTGIGRAKSYGAGLLSLAPA